MNVLLANAPVKHFETIDSTNLEAARLFASGETGPLWLIADEQVAGRGRLDRQWLSPRGNLYSTLLLPLAVPVRAIPQLSFVVALAVHDTVTAHCRAQSITLKWPNDCLLNGGKVAGILCENLGQGTVAIGCGINIASSPQGLAYATSSIAQSNPAATVSAVFETYRNSLQARFGQWQNGEEFPSIIADWQGRAANLNRPISVIQNNITTTGIFRGLAADGALRLEKPDQSIETLYAGDVTPPRQP